MLTAGKLYFIWENVGEPMKRSISFRSQIKIFSSKLLIGIAYGFSR